MLGWDEFLLRTVPIRWEARLSELRLTFRADCGQRWVPGMCQVLWGSRGVRPRCLEAFPLVTCCCVTDHPPLSGGKQAVILLLNLHVE